MQMLRISAQTHITRACGATSKRYLKLGEFDDFKFSNCVFLWFFQKKISYVSKIGSRVGQNQTAVMRICHRWMQEDTMNRRGQLHPPQCTTSREDR
ncbi:uncharacterized protein TNCV_671051 [Trichonephila clavipes]|nr:uncharacterized protein TNCV_671051 [Trichonephila clavipes]